MVWSVLRKGAQRYHHDAVAAAKAALVESYHGKHSYWFWETKLCDPDRLPVIRHSVHNLSYSPFEMSAFLFGPELISVKNYLDELESFQLSFYPYGHGLFPPKNSFSSDPQNKIRVAH